MPGAWTGHFDARSGISYQPWGRLLGRNALLMHSPWHVPPGKTWVDYPLALPKTTPIRLTFGIAMGPDVAVPGKSDGVTFSCYLIADGKPQELMRRHHAKAEWIDYAFDLSPHAGKTITLRLQVEPGPRNDASFDFSFFGDAKITVGNVAEPRGTCIAEGDHIEQGLSGDSGCSLAAVCNTPDPRRRALEPAALQEPHRKGRRRLAIHLRRGRLPHCLYLHAGYRHAG